MTAHTCPTGRHPNPHYSCYHAHGHRCRCDGCRAAAVADNRRRRQQRAYGRWKPRTCDAAATRALLAVLTDQGATRQWISDRTGLHPKTVWEIASRRRDRVRRTTADAVEGLARAVAAGHARPPRYADAERRRQHRLRQRAHRAKAAA